MQPSARKYGKDLPNTKILCAPAIILMNLAEFFSIRKSRITRLGDQAQFSSYRQIGKICSPQQ